MTKEMAEFTKIQKRVEEIKKAKIQAETRLQLLQATLKEEYDCTSLLKAQELLLQLQEEHKEQTKTFNTSLQSFKNKWKDVLDNI